MSVLPQRSSGSISSNDGGILRKGARLPGPVAPNGAVMGDLWYDTMAKSLMVWNGTIWDKVVAAGAAITGGDITASGLVTADRFKLAPNDVDDAKIDLYGGVYLIGIRPSEFYMKSGGDKFTWETPPGAWAMRYGPTEVVGGRGLAVMGNFISGEIYSDGWFRQRGSGRGYYHEAHGGGWFMQDGTYFRIYQDKEIYTNNRIRAGIAAMKNGWFDGNYATFGHNSHSDAYNYGYGQHSDGNCLISCAGTTRIRRDNGAGDMTLMRLADSGGWADVSTPAPMNICGIAAQWGGDQGGNVRQLGGCSSSIRWKEDVRDLPEEVAGINNPVFKFRPVKFKWKENYEGGNGAEVNVWRPNGTTGLIAEEVFDVAPDAVARDADGTPTAPDMYVFFGYLVDAIQYLKNRIDELERKN